MREVKILIRKTKRVHESLPTAWLTSKFYTGNVFIFSGCRLKSSSVYSQIQDGRRLDFVFQLHWPIEQRHTNTLLDPGRRTNPFGHLNNFFKLKIDIKNNFKNSTFFHNFPSRFQLGSTFYLFNYHAFGIWNFKWCNHNYSKLASFSAFCSHHIIIDNLSKFYYSNKKRNHVHSDSVRVKRLKTIIIKTGLYLHLDLSAILLGHVSFAPNNKAIFGFSHSPASIFGWKKLLALLTGLNITPPSDWDSVSKIFQKVFSFRALTLSLSEF